MASKDKDMKRLRDKLLKGEISEDTFKLVHEDLKPDRHKASKTTSKKSSNKKTKSKKTHAKKEDGIEIKVPNTQNVGVAILKWTFILFTLFIIAVMVADSTGNEDAASYVFGSLLVIFIARVVVRNFIKKPVKKVKEESGNAVIRIVKKLFMFWLKLTGWIIILFILVIGLLVVYEFDNGPITMGGTTGTTTTGGSVNVGASGTNVVSVKAGLDYSLSDEALGYKDLEYDCNEYDFFNKGGLDCGDFWVKWEIDETFAGKDLDYKILISQLKDDQVFEELSVLLDGKFALPYDVFITFKECEGGAKNAYYSYADKEITICVELIEHWQDAYGKIYYYPDEINGAVVDTLSFVLFHEMGHAFVDVYNLPITGQEEVAVDQLATWILVESDYGEAAIETTNWFFNNSDNLKLVTYWYQHELSRERFENITCWVYGSDTERWAGYKGVVGDRYWKCEGDYWQVSTSWPKILEPYFKGGPPGTECTPQTYAKYPNMDCGDFSLIYGPNENYPDVEALFKENDLDALPEFLNEGFTLPYDVDINATECGRVNAFYHSGRKDITMCHDLYDHFRGLFGKMYDDEEDVQLASMEAWNFVFFHELGHAMVDVYNLPATGTGENVADQVATYMAVEGGYSEIALSGADWFSLQTEEREQAGSTNLSAYYFADEHALDQQRFFNIVCWVYGADWLRGEGEAKRYQYLVDDGHLPEDRAARCPSEYYDLQKAINTLITPHQQID
ncbi:MAG: hypothetical protein GOV15_02210 [Candidatus Diapherotrites archaeon]|nr:hypothetical protein [Candidatus Diapherotrites archaeon]